MPERFIPTDDSEIDGSPIQNYGTDKWDMEELEEEVKHESDGSNDHYRDLGSSGNHPALRRKTDDASNDNETSE